MANDLNNVFLVGRLTRDAELKYTNSGAAVTRLSIANGYSVKRGDQWEDQTNYFDVTVFGRRGEALNQYLLKGQQIAIGGVLRQERWEQEGQNRSKVVVIANDIQLLGGKQSNSNGSQNVNQGNQQGFNNQKPNVNDSYNNGGGNGNFEDEIPF